jgi:hypothetical protein
MAEKPNGTGVLEVTLGMRVNLNVYGPDGKPVAYNKCELWAEVKAADSASARAELDAQVDEMMGDYALTFGPNAAESPLADKKKDNWSDDQRKFAVAFCLSMGSLFEASAESFDLWKSIVVKKYGQEKYDAFRTQYVKDNPKKS